MLHLKTYILQNFAKKRIQSIGYVNLANKVIERHFDDKIKITGYCKHYILFIKVNPVDYKSVIYFHKKEILQKINNKLAGFGYSIKMIDIKFSK